MPDVVQFIKSYGLKKFLQLNSREQNRLLYNEWPHNKTSNLRMQKNAFLSKLIDKSDKLPTTPPPPKQPIPTSSAPDDRRPPPLAGGLKKLTEEVLENAIVEVLQTDPAKGLSTALAFLDKKKSLSVDDEDTTQQLIAVDKLKQKRDAMFT